MTPYRSRFNLFHALAIGGLSLSAYYGHAWMNLPVYSEQEIEASVELNLAMDLARRGPHLQPDADRHAQLEARIRDEIVGSLQRERETVQRRFGIGLLLLVVGVGRMLTTRPH